MVRVIVISGTPGVGKTTVAKELARRLKGKVYTLSDLALEMKTIIGYDEERKSYIIDEEKLVREVLNIISESKSEVVIFEGHYGELVPQEKVEKLIILRLNPIMLKGRLKRKGWSLRKVIENVEAELLGVCTYNALREYPESKVCEVDVTGKSIEEIVNEILEILKGNVKGRGYIDWLEKLKPEDITSLTRDC